MGKILAYLLSLIYYLAFGSVLVIFHILQWIAFNGFGYEAHKSTVDLLNFFILRCLNLLGTRIYFKNENKLPTDRSLVFVVNHQSTYDIPPIIWYLRKYHPKFISKKELGKGIPSVSFNLRHGGSVLIDRKKPKEALTLIHRFGKEIYHKKQSAVIFPEGTRSRDGHPKKFQKSGLITLFESMPEALVVPISVCNSWKFGRSNYFPMPLGVKLEVTVHPSLEINHNQPLDFIDTLEGYLHNEILRNQKQA
jgi:1-acyl-sn-glycerol-3-phosphate acyltransferase